MAQDLGSAELRIAGTRLVVSPESQTVPFDTPTIIETHLEGFDASAGALPPDLRVLADFSGPQIDDVLTLETVPNEPLRIPRLSLAGEYVVDNIRLVQGVQGEDLLAFAEPRSAAVRVTQVLVTRVTSRALTLDEIRSYGIVVDDDSFKAFDFTFGFAVDGEVVDYNVPILWLPSQGASPIVLGGGGSGQTQRFQPPQLSAFFLEPRDDDGGLVAQGGCDDPSGSCFIEDPPPLPGVLLFPNDLGLLNQFFSVVLMVQNGAPAGDPLVIRDLTAKIELPAGLREAETEPPTPLGVPVPVRVPGPDGQLGTGDDVTFLVAQASGEAEFLLEGLAQGTHVVEMDLEGVLEGLPSGIRRIGGTARGAVVVRDPTFGITVSHPDVVRRDEEYSLHLTVSNTSNRPANLVTLELPASRLSGVELVDPTQFKRTIDSLLPGESEVVEFRLRALRTGRVTAASTRSTSQVTPTFDLTVGVGEAGIPLSPASLVLPRSADLLPPGLVRNSLSLLGLGFSLATAPPSLVNDDLPQVSRQTVDLRVYQLAQAGRHVGFGEETFDSAAVLAAEWLGVRDGDWDWDRLRRRTRSGGRLGDSFAQVFSAEAQTAGQRAAFDRFVRTTGFLPPMVAALGEGVGARVELVSRMSGKRLAGSGLAADRVRELPFADLYRWGRGQMALAVVPEPEGYRAVLRKPDGGSAGLHVLLASEDGSLAVARWTGVDLGPDGVATVEIVPGSADLDLVVDRDGDGLEDDRVPATVTPAAPRPFAPLAAVQNAEVDPTGHVIEVLFSADVDLGSLLPRDPARFELPGKISNGGLIPAEADVFTAAPVLGGDPAFENPFEGLRNTRVVRVVFDNPVSPFVPQELTVRDVASLEGDRIAQQTVPVTTTLETPGTVVEGRVFGPDGEPASRARVELFEQDINVLTGECVRHRTAAVRADSEGRFVFDYVRDTDCGGLFTLEALDPATAKTGRATGRVRFDGAVQRLDVVMLGRGVIRGRVTYDDGTVPANLQVQANHAVFREGRLANVDATGHYDVGDLPVGTVTVAASDGLGNVAFSTVAIPEAGAVVERDLVLVRRPDRPTGNLRGRVLESDGTTPAFNAWVALYLGGELTFVRRSDADGRFDFGTVPAGLAEIEAFDAETGRSGTRVFFEVEPDRVNELDVLLEDERGTIEGFVRRQTLNGLVPVEGAVVFATGTPFHTTTGPDGFYRLENVFVGDREVRAVDLATNEQTSGRVTLSADGQVAVKDLTITQEVPGGIAGRVLDFSGVPVPGATVHLALDDQHWIHEAVTDSSGEFALPDVPPGTYFVHAFRPDGDGNRLNDPGGIARADVRFSGDTPFVDVRFRKGLIRGQVLARNESGELVGVRSVVRYRTTVVRLGLVGLDIESHDLETDADGFFELPEALTGDYVLTVFNAFQGQKTVRGELAQHGEVAEHEIVFERNGTIRGRVLDIDGVTPVAGAEVSLGHPNFSAFDVTTDADGAFVFELVPPTSNAFPVDVLFENGMVFRRARAWVRMRDFGQEIDLEIVLPEQGSVAGRVEDSFGQPVSLADVVLQEGVFPHRRLEQQSDETGRFAFDNVFVGALSVSAESTALGGLGGKIRAELEREGQQLDDLVIRLEATGEIVGRVISPVDGQPVASAEVKLLRSGLFDSTNTDDSGEFRFELLPLGTYTVQAFDPRTGRQGRETGLTVAANGASVTSEVVLEGRGEVAGHLFEPLSTTPVPGATVTLRTSSLLSLTTYASTGPEGMFEFLGVPEGTFNLSAREPDGRRKAGGAGEIASEGDRVLVDLFLEEHGSVTGEVLNPAGAPEGLFSPVNVRVLQDGQLVGASLENPFRFDGLIAGRSFEVEVNEPGGLHRGRATGTVQSQGQEIELDVSMVPRGAVRVSVLDSSGQPVAGADVRLTASGFYGSRSLAGGTGEDHQVQFDDVGAGSLTAFASSPVLGLSGSATGQLSLEGQVAEVSVFLEPAGEVRGRVLLADGVTPAVQALGVLRIAGRTLRQVTDADGVVSFPSVPLGSFVLDFQENLGAGELRRTGSVDVNGQVVDLGDLVLDDEDPQVEEILPASGAVEVSPATSIAVRFSEPLDRSRFTGSWVTLRTSSGTGVPVNHAFTDGDATIVVTPVQPLASLVTYRVRVDGAVDPAGRRMGTAVQTSFTTQDVVPPQVVATSPAEGALQVPRDVQVRVELSEPVEPASLSGAALALTEAETGTGVSTTFTVEPGDRAVLVTPVGELDVETAYRLTVQGVEDRRGNAMSAPFVLNFTTLDDTAPVVELQVPEGPLTEGLPVTLTAVPVDSPDLASVTFLRGDQQLVRDEEAPYGTVYVPDATDREAGQVELSAIGADEVGNLGPASTVVRQVQGDTEPPEVSLLEPSAGLVVTSGESIQVAAEASDNVAVGSVTFQLGERSLVDAEAPYEWTVAAPSVESATDLVLTAEAIDSSGNVGTAEVSVRVEPLFDPDRPEVAIPCPSSGARLAPGTGLDVVVAATDDQGIEKVEFFVGGATEPATTLFEPPYTFRLEAPATATDGEVLFLRVVATDFGGKTTEATVEATVVEGHVLTEATVLAAGDTSLDGRTVVVDGTTLTLDGAHDFRDLVVLGSGTIQGLVRAEGGTGRLALTVERSAFFGCGTRLDVSRLGFAGGTSESPVGEAPAWVEGSQPDAGGSHGGRGVTWDGPGPAGEVYDSVYLPQLAGGGGGRDEDGGDGAPGGGVLVLEVGDLVLDGTLDADGAPGNDNHHPAGAGGTVVIRAGTLSGTGSVRAGGGIGRACASSSRRVGAGGGGRVALDVDQLVGFDPLEQVRVFGGVRRSCATAVEYASAGTIYLETSGSTYGELIVDNLTDGGTGKDRIAAATELPALGTGSVVSVTPQGADAWVEGPEPFLPRWQGAWMALVDASGVDLGAFRVAALDASGQALLEGAGGVTGAATYRGEYRFDRVRVRRGAGLSVTDPLITPDLDVEGASEILGPVETTEMVIEAGDFPFRSDGSLLAENVTVRSGATVQPAAGSELRWRILGTLTVEAGAVIDARGFGFAGGTSESPMGEAPAWVEGSQPDAGGSHGGRGVNWDGPGPAGEVYDSVYVPQLAGGGGGRDEDGGDGSPGGGVLVLEVGDLVLDGTLDADGAPGNDNNHPAGAGGTVVIRAGTLSGTGSVRAGGGIGRACATSSRRVGAGGGGRVALEVDQLVGFDPAEQVKAFGGVRRSCATAVEYASAGTIYLETPESTYGELIVDNLTDGGTGEDRLAAATELPSLGTGSVVSLTPEGADAWVESSEPFLPRWLGAWMGLVDATGVDLGVFRVVVLDGSGRVLLEGASGVTGAATHRGEYRFDRVRVRRGAGLSVTDPLITPDLDVEGASEILGPVETTEMVIEAGDFPFRSDRSLLAENVTVRSGATVQPAAGSELRWRVQGTLTVEAGAVIDARGFGFAGGASNEVGDAPAWVEGSRPDAGGSHGGRGVNWDGPGPAGEVYDSVYVPQLAGGGGGRDEDGGDGSPGGGVLVLEVGDLVLDGTLDADGAPGNDNNHPAGAGGTVVIRAGTLSGTGSVRAGGGVGRACATSSRRVGAGGGGRVALDVDQLVGFDPLEQVRVFGGVRRSCATAVEYASAGTIYLETPGSTYGELIVDNLTDGGTGKDRIAAATELPALGTGSVVSVTPQGADAWVEGPEPFLPRWQGAWMALVDASGVDLGAFRVAALDASGQALLEGAGGVTGAATYRGEYRFDRVRVRRGAGLSVTDPLITPDLDVEGASEILGPVETTEMVIEAGDFPFRSDRSLLAENVTVRSGATVQPAAGSELRWRILGTLTVEAGAVIDARGFGFAGGTSESPMGEAPAWVEGSQPDAGGSHGGRGIHWDGPGPAGEVYDSVYVPQLAGGGGGRDEDGGDGSPGGGVLVLEVGDLVLDGTLDADGAPGNDNNHPAGAGGTVVIRAGTLSGTGSVRAGGGIGRACATSSRRVGAGGGGRVALEVDQLVGFDPAEQVKAFGGSRVSCASVLEVAAPGTIYLETLTHTHGDLSVDSGGAGPIETVVTLPTLGSGTVGAVELSSDDLNDLWIEPQDPDTFVSLGVEGMWVRVDGRDFRLLEQGPPLTRWLLDDAAGLVSPGDLYEGVYKFDRVTVRGGVTLEILDTAEIDQLDVEPGSTVLLP